MIQEGSETIKEKLLRALIINSGDNQALYNLIIGHGGHEQALSIESLNEILQLIVTVVTTDSMVEDIFQLRNSGHFQYIQSKLIENGQAEAVVKMQQKMLTAVVTNGTLADIIKLADDFYFRSIQVELIRNGQAEAVAKMQQEIVTAVVTKGRPAYIINLAVSKKFQEIQVELIRNGQAEAVAAIQQQIDGLKDRQSKKPRPSLIP